MKDAQTTNPWHWKEYIDRLWEIMDYMLQEKIND